MQRKRIKQNVFESLGKPGQALPPQLNRRYHHDFHCFCNRWTVLEQDSRTSKSAISTSSVAFLPLQPGGKHLYLFYRFLTGPKNVFAKVALLYFSMLLNHLKHYLETASLMNWLHPCFMYVTSMHRKVKGILCRQLEKQNNLKKKVSTSHIHPEIRIVQCLCSVSLKSISLLGLMHTLNIKLEATFLTRALGLFLHLLFPDTLSHPLKSSV